MPTRGDLWLVLAGAIAASVNAAAGGGTLLSFPSLLAAGLSPLTANATSTVGLVPGMFASVWAYRHELRALRAEGLLVALPSLVGGALGAWLLFHLGGAVFTRVVPVLLFVAAGLLLVQPMLTRAVQKRLGGSATEGTEVFAATTAGLGPALLVVLCISVYGGYFGAGLGIIFLGTMGLVLARPLAEINALKVLTAACSNAVAVCTFAWMEWRNPQGHLQFRAAIPLAIGAVLGGYFGVGVVRRLPAWALRAFASLVGAGIGFYLWLR